MLAYYCSSVIGDGQTVDTGYRPYLSSMGVVCNNTDAIKEDPTTSKPTNVQCLVIVGATTANQATIAADTNNYQLPFGPSVLDNAMSTQIGQTAFDAMNNALLARGFNVSGWVLSDTCRKVIDGLLGQLGTGQTSQNFTTTDIAG